MEQHTEQQPVVIREFNTNTSRHLSRVFRSGEPLPVVAGRGYDDYVHVVPTDLWKSILDNGEIRSLVAAYQARQLELDLRRAG